MYAVSHIVTPLLAAGPFLWHCECNFRSGYVYNELTGLCDTQQCADGVTFCFAPGTCNDAATSSSCDCPAGSAGVNCETREEKEQENNVCICKLYTGLHLHVHT